MLFIIGKGPEFEKKINIQKGNKNVYYLNFLKSLAVDDAGRKEFIY
jgi:hypothetical protein